MKIQYFEKCIYGTSLWYIKDINQACKWIKITGKKTITQDVIEACEKLFGVEFERVFEN